MEYPLKTCTCYARVQKYNFLTGCLILTLYIPSERHAPKNVVENGLIVCYCSYSIEFQGEFHTKIIIKGIILIRSNTHMNSLPETTFSLSILCSVLIL